MNSLTWIEILRQVLVAAGFGSKRDARPKEPPTKVKKNNTIIVTSIKLSIIYQFILFESQEATLMAKYGLSPGTLKDELFNILSLQGNNGMKISELATHSSVSNFDVYQRKDNNYH